MEANVLASLSKTKESLTYSATQNAEVAKTFMALISNLIVLCNWKGKSVKDVKIGAIRIQSKKLVAHIDFGIGHHVELGWENRNEFYDYTRRKAMRMAKVIEQNPSIINFLERMMGSLESYATAKCIPFRGLKIEKAIIDKNDDLVCFINK